MKNITDESIGGAALIIFFVPDAALIRGRSLFSNYGNLKTHIGRVPEGEFF